MTNFLDLAQEQLAWPTASEIFSPEASGARLLVEQAERRIASALRILGAPQLRAGLLLDHTDVGATPAPLALVLEFQTPASDAVLREAHRLAWNFGRAPVLITIEPTLLRAWSCCEPPPQPTPLDAALPAIETFDAEALLERGLMLLHWASMVSGSFARTYPDRFTRAGRVDYTLLENLRAVRQTLHHGYHLPYPIIHDLLARIIFLQFLMDRKDADGRAALDATRLRQLHEKGILKHPYESLQEILRSVGDTYALFAYLDQHFNGDLFARRDAGEDGRSALARERDHVRREHLLHLSDFVGGRLRFANDQLNLWRLYSFDAIPLEFVSCIYEEFVAKRDGVVYTPSSLVDVILDSVLPWDGTEWDLTVLDPACGSGIFLVKTFQRLVHRWRNAHGGQRIDVQTLRQMLEHNLMGVDADEDAARIAAFSLHLALCDEVEPRYLWERIKFPVLRGRRLLHSDFFADDVPGIRTQADARTFDLVVGNVPWASGSLHKNTPAAQWARAHDWGTFEKNIGPLFLGKALALTKADGRVALLQPATLLFSQGAATFRRRLFGNFRVHEVINFSAIRRELFNSAAGPACVVTLQPSSPGTEPFPYVTPKPRAGDDGVFRVQVDAYDIAMVRPHEAAEDDFVWPALAWGGRRHLALLRRMTGGRTLQSLRENGILSARNGIVWGQSRRTPHPELKGRLEFSAKRLPVEEGLFLSRQHLQPVQAGSVHHKDQKDLSAFTTPQLIIRRSWDARSRRFQAMMLRPDDAPGAVVSQNYVSVHAAPEHAPELENAARMINSRLAVFYHALTSGRFVSERPNLSVTQVLALPLPLASPSASEPAPAPERAPTSPAAVDRWARAAWQLDDVEWALVEDMSDIVLPESQAFSAAAARHTIASHPAELAHLRDYCEYGLKVLRAAWSSPNISATIYEPAATLGVRVVAFHLDGTREEPISAQLITSRELLDKLTAAQTALRARTGRSAPLQRVARLYLSTRGDIPGTLIFKPNELRYWTRSIALRDADEIVSDAVRWMQTHD